MSVEALIQTGLYPRHEYNRLSVGGKLRQRIYFNFFLLCQQDLISISIERHVIGHTTMSTGDFGFLHFTYR
jgi:hypothetical protein